MIDFLKGKEKTRASLFIISFLSTLLISSMSLAKSLDDLIVKLTPENARTGVVVMSLDERRPLYRFNPNSGFLPASTHKILSTLASLEFLGANYRFETIVGTNKKKRQAVEDLIIRGQGDPSLTSQHLNSWVQKLQKKKVQKVLGDIKIDNSFFEFVGDKPKSKKYYHAVSRALSLNKNTRKETLVKANKEIEKVTSVESPESYFRSELLTKLHGQNISVLNQKTSKTKLKKVLLKHRSKPLSQIIHHAMKDSSNFTSDMIFQTLAAEAIAKPGNRKNGVVVLNRFLKSIHAPLQNSFVADGSGLSRANKLTPELLSYLLNYAYFSKHFDDFYNSLSIAGIDGTLKERFLKTPHLVGNVHAKTGTLYDASTLAGYINTKSGRQLSFVILSNGPGALAGKYFPLHEQVLDYLYKHY